EFSSAFFSFACCGNCGSCNAWKRASVGLRICFWVCLQVCLRYPMCRYCGFPAAAEPHSRFSFFRRFLHTSIPCGPVHPLLQKAPPLLLVIPQRLQEIPPYSFPALFLPFVNAVPECAV